MPKTYGCEKCQASVPLTPEQFAELNRRLQVTFTCPKCHTTQTRRLIPPLSETARAAAASVDQAPAPIAPVPENKPIVVPAPPAPPPWGSAVQPVLTPQMAARASAPASEAPPWGQRKNQGHDTGTGQPPARQLGPARAAQPEPDEHDEPMFNARPKRSLKQKMADMPPFAQYGLLFGAIVLMAVVVFAIPTGDSTPPKDKAKTKTDFTAPKDEPEATKDKESPAPKSDDPKKEEPKKEEPKVEPKKEEPKVEPKKEEPKKTDNMDKGDPRLPPDEHN